MDEYLNANRKLWDQWTVEHEKSAFYDLEGFKAGKDRLRSIELTELGNVAGKMLLHLQFGYAGLGAPRRYRHWRRSLRELDCPGALLEPRAKPARTIHLYRHLSVNRFAIQPYGRRLATPRSPTRRIRHRLYLLRRLALAARSAPLGRNNCLFPETERRLLNCRRPSDIPIIFNRRWIKN